jgi:hypothetical protein
MGWLGSLVVVDIDVSTYIRHPVMMLTNVALPMIRVGYGLWQMSKIISLDMIIAFDEYGILTKFKSNTTSLRPAPYTLYIS